MKKVISIFLAMVLTSTLFTGCGHEHTWQEASCNTPKTCTACNETEGEMLTHKWQYATCATPKKCSVCNTSDGDTLPHTLSEANYQSATICSICSAEVGEPLTALFEEKGYSLMTENTEYDYNAVARNNRSIKITGKASVSDYRIVDTDETHEPKEGYEWRIANVNYTFSGADAHRDGYTFSVSPMDYYVGISKLNTDGDTIINYNGIEYERNTQYKELQNGWYDDVGRIILEVALQVPTGYDGAVLCLFNPVANDTKSGEKLSLTEIEMATPLFFRME